MSHYEEAQRIFNVEVDALRTVLAQVESDFERAVEMIRTCRGKVASGIGKSGIIAHKIAATLASTGTPAVFLNGEALHGDLGVVAPDDVLLMLSNSAKIEAELLQMLPSIKAIEAKIIGLFGSAETRSRRLAMSF